MIIKRELSISDKLNLVWAKLSFGKKERNRVYRQLARMVQKQITVQNALEAIYKTESQDGKKKTDPVAIILNEWIENYKKYGQFHAAVKEWVPLHEYMLILAGGSGEQLPDTLNNIIHITKSRGKITKTLVKATIYPFFLILTLIGVLILFSVEIIPAFGTIVPVETWTGMPALMASISKWVQIGIIPFVIFIVISLSLYFYSLPRWTSKKRSKLDLYPPFLLYKLSQGAAFLLSLAALMRAGKTTVASLDEIKNNSNPWLKKRITATIIQLRAGKNLGQALNDTGYAFPDRSIISEITTYSEMDNFDKSLEELGFEWLEEVVEKIEASAGIINSVLLFIMFGFVLFMGAGLFSIQEMIASNTGF